MLDNYKIVLELSFDEFFEILKLVQKLPTGNIRNQLEQTFKDKSDFFRNNNTNTAAVALGRRGGKKGGDARAKALSPERRSEIASKAAQARWSKCS